MQREIDPVINKMNILVNVLLISGIILIIYCYLPKFCNWAYPENDWFVKSEEYAPDRERTDNQNDWDIIEEVNNIKRRQQENLSHLSQNKGYGI